MTGKSASSTTEPKENRPRRALAAPSGARPDTATLIQGLDRLRDGLIQRLERIESIAVEQARLLDQDSSEREDYLRDRVSVLEAAQARRQAEAKRREQEWLAVLQQLEADRRLLAEAWERLESQQLETGHGPPSAPVAPVERAAVERPVVHRQPNNDPDDDPVTRAILRQFQALKGDVRRNAKGRNGR